MASTQTTKIVPNETSRSSSSTSSATSKSPPAAASITTAATNMNPVVEISPLRTKTQTATSSTVTTVLPLTATVKHEVANEEIKEFAETAMNELLGWYGYGTAATESSRNQTRNGSAATVTGNVQQAVNGEGNSSAAAGGCPKKELPLRNRSMRMARPQQPPPPPNTLGTRSPHSLSNSPPRSSPSAANENYLAAAGGGGRGTNNCDWCHRTINADAETFGGTTEGVRFCSEPCFAQSRRATFKRAKTCDWCRHVRHAVSYVDFQDGASQLQFCSDKCLNQYKMQIFIKETQAHLEMNPHLMDQGEGSGGNLITPELWLKNCRSRSASPEQSRSGSITPDVVERDKRSDAEKSVPTSVITRPTITVAPVSKLLPQKMPQTSNQMLNHVDLMASRPSMKTMRKRRTLRNGPPVRDHPSNFAPRSTVADEGSSSAQQNAYRPQQISVSQAENAGMKLSTGGQSRMNDQIPLHHPFEGRFLSPPPNLFPIRPNLMPGAGTSPHMLRPATEQVLPPMPNLRPATTMNRESVHHQQQQQQQIPMPHHLYPPQPFMGLPGQIPPVTILVPCPIILPIPVPIPIPINMAEFFAKIFGAKSDPPKSSENVTENSSKSMPVQRTSPSNDVNNNTRERDSPNSVGINCSMSSNSRPEECPFETKSQPEEERGNRNESESELSDNESSVKSSELVPKIKITRLQSKRILTSRELDSSRPLRKRKRMVVDAYT